MNQNPVSICYSSQSSNSVSSTQIGIVDKISVKKFILDQEHYVFRLKNGPPSDLTKRIDEAMDENEEYHLLRNNCLHFALRVLGVGKCKFH